jgi:hypothetical protein
MQVLREQAAPIAAALVEEILDNPLGHANRRTSPASVRLGGLDLGEPGSAHAPGGDQRLGALDVDSRP